MALCCEMYNSVDIVLGKNLLDCLLVTDISPYKCIVRLVCDILEVLKVSCVGEHIHIDDADSVAILLKHVVYVV